MSCAVSIGCFGAARGVAAARDVARDVAPDARDVCSIATCAIELVLDATALAWAPLAVLATLMPVKRAVDCLVRLALLGRFDVRQVAGMTAITLAALVGAVVAAGAPAPPSPGLDADLAVGVMVGGALVALTGLGARWRGHVVPGAAAAGAAAAMRVIFSSPHPTWRSSVHAVAVLIALPMRAAVVARSARPTAPEVGWTVGWHVAMYAVAAVALGETGGWPAGAVGVWAAALAVAWGGAVVIGAPTGIRRGTVAVAPQAPLPPLPPPPPPAYTVDPPPDYVEVL